MLNIYIIKKKNNIKDIKLYSGELSPKAKRTIPSNKEWYNSVYTFNKNSLKLLPLIDNIITSLLRSYFRMYFEEINDNNKKNEKNYEKDSKSKSIKIFTKWISSRRIWLSKPEIKHTNNKVIITLYIYNREYNYYKKELKTLWNYWFKYKKLDEFYKIFYQLIDDFFILNKFSQTISSKNPTILKYFNEIFFEIITFIKLKQKRFFNELKFSNYITNVKQILQEMYKKDVDFNLISLKNYYLSSNILSQIVSTKLSKRKSKVLKILNVSLRNIKIPVLNETTVKQEHTKYKESQNLIIYNNIDAGHKKNYFSPCLTIEKIFNNKYIQRTIKENIQNKLISGIKLKVSGRITKRIIAERAITKVVSKGTLKNITSSYKGLSSELVLGFKKSSLQNTKLGSKTHVGAFGLKGWVSSY